MKTRDSPHALNGYSLKYMVPFPCFNQKSAEILKGRKGGREDWKI